MVLQNTHIWVLSERGTGVDVRVGGWKKRNRKRRQMEEQETVMGQSDKGEDDKGNCSSLFCYVSLTWRQGWGGDLKC